MPGLYNGVFGASNQEKVAAAKLNFYIKYKISNRNSLLGAGY